MKYEDFKVGETFYTGSPKFELFGWTVIKLLPEYGCVEAKRIEEGYESTFDYEDFPLCRKEKE